MTLQQQVSQLIGQWAGTDATQRGHVQDQVASDLISLVLSASDVDRAIAAFAEVDASKDFSGVPDRAA
jgi:hypothetical protein